MYTVLIKGTGERVWYPNARLLQAPLANLSRTQHRAEAASFAVDSGRAGLAVRQALIVSLWGCPKVFGGVGARGRESGREV
jgi:hypothetical protein